MMTLLDVRKYDDMRMRLDTIPALKVKGQTDRQTDRQTDGIGETTARCTRIAC